MPSPSTGSPSSDSPYTDLRRPPLRAAALRGALVAPAGPLARLEVLDEVGSTNTDLVAAAVADPAGWPHLSVITAEHQDAGRGRAGRVWSAPARSGLATSVLLRLDRAAVPQQRWSWLPLLAGMVVVDVLGEGAELKWPNDVLLGGGKVAGVLTEALPDGGGVVLGIGLNVTLTAAELPVPTATSLELAGAPVTDRDVLLRSLLRSLAGEVARWAAAGGDPAASGLGDRVRAACASLGREVVVDLPGGRRARGTGSDLDDDGRLVLATADGPLAVSAGDVAHPR